MMFSASSRRLVSRLLLLVGGLALGVGLIFLLLRSVNPGQLGADLRHVDYRFLLPALPLFLINWLLKVPRWGILFGPDTPDGDTLFGAMNVGYAVNTLLPARLGEVVRAYWIRDRTGIGMVQTLSTIAVERVSDGVTLLVLFAVMAPTVALPGKLVGPAVTVGIAFVAVLAVMGVLAYASAGQRELFGIMRRLETGRLAPVAGIIRQVLTGLHALRSRRALGLLAFYTAVIWASNFGLLYFMLRALHIDAPFTAAILLTAVLNLGMAVPSTPGYIGVFETLMVLTLALYNVHRTPAVAAAFIFHIVTFVPVTIVGIIYLARAGLRVSLDMVRSSATGAPAPLASGTASGYPLAGDGRGEAP